MENLVEAIAQTPIRAVSVECRIGGNANSEERGRIVGSLLVSNQIIISLAHRYRGCVS